MEAARPTPMQHEKEPVSVLERDGVTYTILGTAHVSRTSAEAVEAYLQDHDFDCVAVELCPSRHQAMTDRNAWRKLDLFQIVRQRKAGMVAANLVLGAYQRRIAEQFGIEPGAEMKAAIERAKAHDSPVALIDRDVGITLKRVFRSVGFFQKLTILSGLLLSLVTKEEITEEEIEKLKEGDMLESTFSEFAAQSESLYHGLIAERDEYMAARLREEAAEHGYKNVFVVIGAGHLKGLAQHLQDDTEPPQQMRERLTTIPPAGWFAKSLPWLITTAVLSGFAYGFSQSPEMGWAVVATWVLTNGVLAALGALIARAHPLTILSAFIAAPVTSLNPLVAAGMVTGSLEATLRKPTVDDFEALREDVTTAKGWWRNRVSRVLLVFVLSNLGSSLGTWIAGYQIVDKLF